MNKSERFWDKLSKNYDKQALGDKTYLKTLELTKKYLKTKDIVLDFGCATGLYSLELSDKVKKIYGFDISNKMIDIANNKAKEQNIYNIEFKKTTIFDKTYEKESFDVILAFHIILYFEDTQQLMKRMNELLKPGGLIITATACLKENKKLRNYFMGSLLSLLKRLKILPYLKFFKVHELERYITKGNFQILESELLSYSPAVEYYIVAKRI
jgi:ubiquinone biosynthesis O-methyltransferase